MRAAWTYFDSFPQAAKEFAQFAQTKLTMPVLTIGGDKANGTALAAQGKIVATNATSVVLPNTGHWLMEENMQGTTDALMRFLASQLGGLQAEQPLDALAPGAAHHEPSAAAQHDDDISVTGGMELRDAIELDDR
jgi:hypothetical protein